MARFQSARRFGLAFLAALLVGIIGGAGERATAQEYEAPPRVMERFPPKLVRLFRPAASAPLPAPTESERLIMERMRREAAAWIRTVVAEPWLPEEARGADGKLPLGVTRDEFGRVDTVRGQWEAQGYRLRVTQTATVLVIVAEPTTAEVPQGIEAGQPTTVRALVKRLIRDHEKVEAWVGEESPVNLAPHGTLAALQESSFNRVRLETCADGLIGRPRQVNRQRDDADARRLGHWWWHMGWWTDGRRIGLYTLKDQDEPWAPMFCSPRDDHWFGPGVWARPAAREKASRDVIIENHQFILCTREAAELFRQARACDAQYCPEDQRDRDKAADLYARAIAAQPAAPINARLANRIAQMYAFYADPAKGIRPDHRLAAEWWRKCIAMTTPRQKLWAEAHMGIGCGNVIGHDAQSAAAAFLPVLQLDENEVELPPWELFAVGDDLRTHELLQQDLDRLRKDSVEIKVTAVEKIRYALRPFGKETTAKVMEEIRASYPGTAVAEEAERILKGLGPAGAVP